MTAPAVTLTLHPDLAELVRPRGEAPRAPGVANAGVVVGIRPDATAAHLRDMAAVLLDRAEAMDGRACRVVEARAMVEASE